MALSHGVFRLLPWTSSLGVNKLTPEMLVTPTQHKSPVMGSAPLQLLKRKRSDNHEIFTVIDEPPPTKRRVDIPNQTDVVESSSTNVTPPSDNEAAPSPNPASSVPIQTRPELQPSASSNMGEHGKASQGANKIPAKQANIDMNILSQSLDAQLSLEVLLKHNELRLIDQEIAKCQIALEQLRRCAEIPYPGSSANVFSQSVSDGSGYAIPYSGTGPPPVSPAPWGVADGPYSRHYAKWLLPDPRFDGGESPDLPIANPTAWDGRATRGSFTENGYVAGKSRAQRGSVSTRLQSLPSGYPAPKEKAGPMVIKRKSDNKLVKLVCLDCRRYDFSSTQGFINHCRIAHSRTFASHDAAAEACGEPVDVDEAGTVIGGTTSEPSTISTPGSVHPLIRSAHTIEKTPKTTPTPSDVQPRNANQTPVAKTTKKKGRSVPPSSSFKASPDAPHLSTMMAVLGSKLNLDEIVGDAKKTVDLSEFLSEGESEDEDEPRPEEPAAVSGARLPARTTMPQAASQRPTSSKRHEASHVTSMPHSLDVSTPTKVTPYSQSQFPPPSSLPSALNLDGSSDAVCMDENLSPVTVVSNQAPSLVSDNEDEFEAVSDSESLSSRPSNNGHDDDDLDDVEVEDYEGTTASTNAGAKTRQEVNTLKRSQGKKGDRVLPPAIVSLDQGGKQSRGVSFDGEQNSPSKSKKASNPKKRH
jgi:ADA HAT complex component 1